MPSSALAIDEFPVPTSFSYPSGIALGPDGAVWFTEENGNKIGRITTNGTITEYPIPTSSSSPSKITAGPDGALWFTEFAANQIGRIHPSAVSPNTSNGITEFPVPGGSSSGKSPDGIAAGPAGDNHLWFTEFGGNQIGRITTGGSVAEYSLSGFQPGDIAVGPDNRMWFLEEGAANKLGVIDPANPGSSPPEFDLPAGSDPSGIVASGGAIWFTAFNGNYIGRASTTNGSVSNQFPIPTAGTQPSGIALGPDGALWFTETSNSANNIGRMTTGGSFTEFSIPTPTSDPSDIVAGADGALWFTELVGNKIGRIVAPSAGGPLPPPSPPTTTQQAKASVLSLGVSPSKFRAARKGASISARVGSTVRYRLSAAATTGFSVERQTVGRKKGKKCVPKTRRNRRAKRCKLFVKVRGSFTHAGKAGANSFRFTGRIAKKKLRPGRYQLVASVPSTGTKPRRAAFKIIRG
jgi:virginiamycin B lyase